MHGLCALKRSILWCFGFRNFSRSIVCDKAVLTSVLDKWTKKFESKGIPDAASSAELISAHVLGKKTLHNVNTDKLQLGVADVSTIDSLCHLRLKRMPVQYVIGEWDFDGLTLKMKPPVFIPRPETEELVDHCKQILESCQREWIELPSPTLLEVGCGSGAITLALLKHFHQLSAVCVEILPEACHLTRMNAELVGVGDRVNVLNGDLTSSEVLSELQELGSFCFLVSNPPYVTWNEMEELAPEISRFENQAALNGGADGLDLVKYILHHASNLVMPHGHIFMEVGECHPALIENYVAEHKALGLQFIAKKKDMYEKNRFCHLQAT